LVSAAELCARAGARIPFVLFGDGPERQLLEELIRQKRLQSVVRLFGHSDEVRTYLPGADAYLNTSVFEGVSLTILEAMAAGLPVVATEVGGTPEVVVDGETGILVRPRAVQRIADSILALAQTPRRARDYGTAGRERAVERFSIGRMVDAYRDVYQQLGRRQQCAA